ncbi:alpha/beta hydrolase [Cohnella panacarvi]|uniref:alpha/beta hydrolase n=1 Tax=Cohnella panacarvi TaxID=400776 RepID=UPI00047C1312|nr:alpha/beta fold hydrolase [Cohnella panacarvi]
MSVLAWLVGGIGAAAGSMTAAVYGLTVKAQKPRQLPNETVPPVPYEDVSWQSQGKSVRGWFMPRPGTVHGEASPVIVVAHGWGSNRSRVLRYALPLHEEGFAILMYDARSHGESDHYRTPSGLQFRDDLCAAIDWLRTRQDIEVNRIGVIGHSLGAFGAVLAIDAGAPIAALVTDSMPVRLATMIGAELRRRKLPQFPLAHLIPQFMVWRSRIPRAMMRRANPVKILRDNAEKNGAPVLLVHSRRDELIPVSELNLVLAGAPGLPHLYVEAEGHSASDRDPAFWPVVKRFFGERLKK